MPRRVKVEGDLFHPKVPEGAVYVGRSAPGLKRSAFYNAHRVGKPCVDCSGAVHSPAEAVALFRAFLDTSPYLVRRTRRELAGRDLACWCPPPNDDEPDVCHGQALLTAANDGGAL